VGRALSHQPLASRSPQSILIGRYCHSKRSGGCLLCFVGPARVDGSRKLFISEPGYSKRRSFVKDRTDGSVGLHRPTIGVFSRRTESVAFVRSLGEEISDDGTAYEFRPLDHVPVIGNSI
jgi:hypothetical protein